MRLVPSWIPAPPRLQSEVDRLKKELEKAMLMEESTPSESSWEGSFFAQIEARQGRKEYRGERHARAGRNIGVRGTPGPEGI